MTAKSDYLERYGIEVDTQSRRVLMYLTDDQFQIVMEAAQYISGGDEPKPGVTCAVDVVHFGTADIDRARLKNWTLPGKRKNLPLDIPAVMYYLAQVRAGGPWLSMVVLDFDFFRVALYAWLYQVRIEDGILSYHPTRPCVPAR